MQNDGTGGPPEEKGIVGLGCYTRVMLSAASNRIKRFGKKSTTRGPNLFDSKLAAYAGQGWLWIDIYIYPVMGG